jgi:hypothetical protein
MTANLEQEPSAPLGLVDPSLDETGARNVVMAVADSMYFSETSRQGFAVFAQL